MKKKHIIFYLLGTLLIMLLFLPLTVYKQVYQCGQSMILQVEYTFPKAIKRMVEDKMEKEHFDIPVYIHNPEKKKIGEYETRTATYPDTSFTFVAKVVSREDYVFGLCQTYLLDAGKLEPGPLKQILDSMLYAKGINIHTEVGITSAFHTKIDKWSNDTTQMSVKHRFSIPEQGNYEDINYYLLIDYPIAMLWKLMPKIDVYFLIILILTTIIILVSLYIKIKKEKKPGIILLKSGKYGMKEILLDVQQKALIIDRKKYKPSPQQYELITLFLQADKQRVNKYTIKRKFWPSHDEANSNMTTCINRLKKKLEEIESGYTIITDPINEDFYCLVFVDHSHASDY